MNESRNPSLTLRSPAKINLFLHIIGQRADGYHLLQSAFQLIDWCDTIYLRSTQDNKIHRINPIPGVQPENDLVVRAARLLNEHCHTQHGVEISVKKEIHASSTAFVTSSMIASTTWSAR